MTRARRRPYCPAGAAGPTGTRRRLASWLGVVALLWGVIVGAALPAGAQARPGVALDHDGVVMVCTAAGMVAIDAGAPAADVPATSAGAGLCVFCLPLMQAGIDIPVAQIATSPDFAPRQVAMPAQAIHLTGLAPAAGPAAPRAPPLS